MEVEVTKLPRRGGLEDKIWGCYNKKQEEMFESMSIRETQQVY